VKNSDIEQLAFGSWPVPEVYLAEIGRVGVVWRSLEAFVNICLAKLAGLDIEDPKGLILFEHLSLPQKLDLPGALGEQLAPDYPNLENLSDAISKIKSAQKLRNEFMHKTVSYDEKEKALKMAVGSAREKLKVEVRTVALTEIKRATVEISEAMRALYKVVLMRDVPPAWE